MLKIIITTIISSVLLFSQVCWAQSTSIKSINFSPHNSVNQEGQLSGTVTLSSQVIGKYYLTIDSNSQDEDQVASGNFQGNSFTFNLSGSTIESFISSGDTQGESNSISHRLGVYVEVTTGFSGNTGTDAQGQPAGGGSGSNNSPISQTVEFYFDNTPPGIAENLSTAGGDKLLTLSWEHSGQDMAGDNETNKNYFSYIICYREKTADDEKNDAAAPTALNQDGNTEYKSADPEVECEGMSKVNSSNARATIFPLTNDKSYRLLVLTKDAAGNIGYSSKPIYGTPIPSDDFFEHYKNAGGGEEGGFCFVATSIYGNYDHPQVKILRQFRDQLLKPTFAGQLFIKTYYKIGPFLASWLDSFPRLKTTAKPLMAPVVGLSWLLVKTAPLLDYLAWTILLSFLAFVLFSSRNWQKLFSRIMLVFLALGVMMTINSRPAEAYFELKFGYYQPSIDSDSSLGKKTGKKSTSPFQDIFGNKSNLLMQVELDWELLQEYGTLAIGGSGGFAQAVGKAVRYQNQVQVAAPDTTVFNIVPTSMNLVYRFDILQNYYNFPLVPYGKVGFSCYFWWITNGVGEISEFKDNDKTYKASGSTYGFHYSAGLQFLLDVLEPSAAKGFDVDFGVNHTYIFAEYQVATVDDFGDENSFNLSDKTFAFGIMFEF